MSVVLKLLSTHTLWWTTSLFTIGPPTNVWYVYIDNLPMQGDFAIDFLHSVEGFSVRCVKD